MVDKREFGWLACFLGFVLAFLVTCRAQHCNPIYVHAVECLHSVQRSEEEREERERKRENYSVVDFRSLLPRACAQGQNCDQT